MDLFTPYMARRQEPMWTCSQDASDEHSIWAGATRILDPALYVQSTVLSNPCPSVSHRSRRVADRTLQARTACLPTDFHMLPTLGTLDRSGCQDSALISMTGHSDSEQEER